MKMISYKAMALAIIIASVLMPVVSSGYAGDEKMRVPRVSYLEPQDEGVIDLTGKDSLAFRWRQVPMPAGGREAFRFRIYKDFSYEVVFGAELGRGDFSIEVPADKFENGQLYSWHVQQRDAANMIWGRYDTWCFKVKK